MGGGSQRSLRWALGLVELELKPSRGSRLRGRQVNTVNRGLTFSGMLVSTYCAPFMLGTMQ